MVSSPGQVRKRERQAADGQRQGQQGYFSFTLTLSAEGEGKCKGGANPRRALSGNQQLVHPADKLVRIFQRSALGE